MSIRSETQPAQQHHSQGPADAAGPARRAQGYGFEAAAAKPARRPRSSHGRSAAASPGDPSILSAWVAGGTTLARFAYGWSGVWVSMLLILQFTQLGLKPALDERDRLSEWAPTVEDNYWEARDAFEWLEAEAVAWQDPIYRERRRRIQKFGLPSHSENSFGEQASNAAWDTPEGDYDPRMSHWSADQD